MLLIAKGLIINHLSKTLQHQGNWTFIRCREIVQDTKNCHNDRT